jgi:3-hydroxybutyryl-CoA dehydrogenase
MSIGNIGVRGCGLMRARIAEVAARAGKDVVVAESSSEAASAGLKRIRTSLKRAESRGKITSAEDVLTHVRVVADLAELADRELVVEAIVEDEGAKVGVVRQAPRDRDVTGGGPGIQHLLDPDHEARRGDLATPHVLGVHFCNPVPVLSLVELVPSLLTSPETTQRARDFVQNDLGKQAIDCQDRAGFVVNALLIPFTLSAIRMSESGFATAEDID